MKHEIFKCSSCDKKLADIAIRKEDAGINHKIRVDCPFCGDKSFIKTISGLIAPGSVEGCDISDIDYDGEVFNIRTSKNEKGS